MLRFFLWAFASFLISTQSGLAAAVASEFPDSSVAADRVRQQRLAATSSAGLTLIGNTLYHAQEHSIARYAVSDPAHPSLQSRLQLRGFARHLSAQGSTIFASVLGSCQARGEGLLVIDWSQAKAPNLTGAYNPPKPTPDMIKGCGLWSIPVQASVRSGAYLFMVDLGRHLHVLSDLNAPQLSEHTSLDLGGRGWDLVADSGFVYVAAGSAGLQVIDTRGGGEPRIIGHFPTKGEALAVTVTDDRIFLIDDGEGLVILDRSPAEAPRKLAGLGVGLFTFGLAVAGDTAYLADYRDGLLLVSVPKGAEPQLLSSLVTDSHPWDVVVKDQFAYLAADSLMAIDLSKIKEPEIIPIE